jgi:hypothetical protein
MEEERLSQLEALADGVTPGPWSAVKENGRWSVFAVVANNVLERVCKISLWTPEVDQREAVFIAAARSAMPELIAEVRRLRGKR